jgi:phosphopantetheinyl transferase
MSAALEASGAFLTGFCRPDEARALASQAALRAGFLSPAEESHYLSLRCEKRRLDWLAGRAAAKRALRRYFRETAGSEPELAALEIASDAQGAPFCAAPAAPSFSISHCAAGGLCAVGLSGRRVGADWEMVAPRSRELARIFACPGELSPDQDDPRGQTRLWAVKEAVLKLLGLGLAASPREIQTQPWLDLAGRARERWLELGSPTLLPAMAQTDDSVVAVVHTQPRS